MPDYRWVPWFQELAGKILETGQADLYDRVQRINWGAPDPAITRYGKDGVDPFSFLYFLAQRNTTNQIRPVYGSVSEEFDLSCDFHEVLSIPSPLPHASALFHDGKVFNPDALWSLFRGVARPGREHGAVAASAFENVLQIPFVAVRKLTQTLFLIDPEDFLPIDRNLEKVIKNFLNLDIVQAERAIEDGGYRRYMDIVTGIKGIFPGCYPYEINEFMYVHQKEPLIKHQGKVFQVGTNVYGDGIDLWDVNSAGIHAEEKRTFKENYCVYVGGQGGKQYPEKGKQYPLTEVDRGDIILVRWRTREGRAIGIVERNEYKNQDKFNEKDAIHVLWINKTTVKNFENLPQFGFSRAGRKTIDAFRSMDKYKISFRLTQLMGLDRPKEKTLNVILYGPPGTGKTHATARRCVRTCDGPSEAEISEAEIRKRYKVLIKEKRVEFVTFHQSYGYEEFVEGLRPDTGSAKEGEETAGFRLVATGGVLKRIAERAREAYPKPYVLVIDEINRANVSKVLGELVTLLEEDKREGEANEIGVTLPHSGARFALPSNLHILGTMNTADRSIALLDTALRRRFDFEELAPDPGMLSAVDGVDLPAVLRAINGRLEWLIDRDHLIGHAWLMNAKDRDDIDRIMRRKIIPLIAEYFYDDWEKVQSVLGGGDGFVQRQKLDPPPGIDDDSGETRYRWTVRSEIPEDAYDRLVSGTPAAAPTDDD